MENARSVFEINRNKPKTEMELSLVFFKSIIQSF